MRSATARRNASFPTQSGREKVSDDRSERSSHQAEYPQQLLFSRSEASQLNSVRAPLLAQARLVSEPFRQRISDVRAEADEIDREAEVHREIERMRPDADKLRTAVGDVFAKAPTRHWQSVLHEIADSTKVGEIDIDFGDGNNDPNQSSDAGEGGEP
jgi:hypothetical protein